MDGSRAPSSILRCLNYLLIYSAFMQLGSLHAVQQGHAVENRLT